MMMACSTKSMPTLTGTVKGADGALAVAGGLAADATVTGKVGSSAATGGTFTGILTYAMANNGVE